MLLQSQIGMFYNGFYKCYSIDYYIKIIDRHFNKP